MNFLFENLIFARKRNSARIIIAHPYRNDSDLLWFYKFTQQNWKAYSALHHRVITNTWSQEKLPIPGQTDGSFVAAWIIDSAPPCEIPSAGVGKYWAICIFRILNVTTHITNRLFHLFYFSCFSLGYRLTASHPRLLISVVVMTSLSNYGDGNCGNTLVMVTHIFYLFLSSFILHLFANNALTLDICINIINNY